MLVVCGSKVLLHLAKIWYYWLLLVVNRLLIVVAIVVVVIGGPKYLHTLSSGFVQYLMYCFTVFLRYLLY